MIDRSHALAVARQARELGISRGSVYYLPRPTSAADLAIMRRIDALHMDFPFAGSRMLRDLLATEGIKVGRLHVSTLMKKMATEEMDGGRTPRSRRRDTRTILSAAQAGSYAAQAGSGDRHHLHPDGAGLCLSDSHCRLVQPACAQLAVIDHAGDRLLH
jgi:hypothetical protein